MFTAVIDSRSRWSVGWSMISILEPNIIILESITAVNNGMQSFKGNILFTSHDYEILNTVANRIIEILPDGSFIDRKCTYEEYLDYKRSLAESGN